MTVCQMQGCENPAERRPVMDANPVPELRRPVGTVAICPACQQRVDSVNARVR